MTDAEFRESMAALPEPPSNSVAPFWDFWRHDLWTRAQSESPDSFMAWPCIYHTMLVDHFDMTQPILYLVPERERWNEAAAAPNVSLRLALIEQAHHLKRWEDTTGKRIESLDRIFEFGGGFGAMALVAHRLGFAGEYVICDLPEFSLLQRWFLARHGVSVKHVEAGEPLRADVLMGLYSISEIPPQMRDEVFETTKAESYLLLYSSRFADYDNDAYFARFMQRVNLDWSVVPFPGRPSNWYAIGC